MKNLITILLMISINLFANELQNIHKIHPSFECTVASTQIEKDICKSNSVSSLDSKLGSIYNRIKKDISNKSFKKLILFQRKWLKERDSKCSKQVDFLEREKCLLSVYQERLNTFRMYQFLDSKASIKKDFDEVYNNGSGVERLKFASYLYSEKKDRKLPSKLLRKIIADGQEESLHAMFALIDMNDDYREEFPEISDSIFKDNDNSIAISLISLKGYEQKITDVLIEESYLLNMRAQIMLSIRYNYIVGGEAAFNPKILSFYQTCADEGMPRCEEILGKIYLYGNGVKKDVAKGIDLLRKSQMRDSYLTLGDYYYTQNMFKESKDNYIEASILGSLSATYNLGVLAQEEKKYKIAIKYFKQVLKQDSKYYAAMLELSRMHIEGWGTLVNYKKGIDLLTVIITSSEDTKLKNTATNNLGIAHYKLGLEYIYINKDMNMALIHIQKSANLGNMYGQYELAKFYFNGTHVGKNESKVIKYYQLSADQGYSLAQFYLGLRYYEGRGVKKDIKKATKYIKMSAENGSSKGAFLYGVLLRDINKIESDKWLNRACVDGIKSACQEFK